MAVSMLGIQLRRVEHAENVYARLGALVNEGADQVVRVAGVADEVRAAQQHLEGDVRDLLPQHDQPLPGGLVEGSGRPCQRSPPHISRGEAVGEDVRRTLGAP